MNITELVGYEEPQEVGRKINEIILNHKNVDNTSDLNKPISNLTQLALNNKVNKSDLVEIFCLIRSYKSFLGYCNVYSNGYCEQGGIFPRTATGILTIPLIQSYASADYFVHPSLKALSTYTSAANFYSPYVLSQTKDDFKVSVGSNINYIGYFVWTAKGYIDE